MDSVSLRVADSISWHTAAGYSSSVAHAICRAYALLRVGRRDLRGYIAAYQYLQPHLRRPMARHQYLRVAYVMALAHAAVGDNPEAIDWCDDALTLADALDIPGARVELLNLRGQCERALLRFRASAADHRQALGLFRQLVSRGEPLEAAVEMELLTQLAGTEFSLGEYAMVRRRLDDAIAIRRRIKIDPLTAVIVEWMETHLFRWRRQPASALQPALAAAQVYAESGSPASAARIQTLTADVQLDFAGTLPEGSDRDSQIAAAGAHITLAQELAEEAHDELGAGLALLTEIRYSRMAGENEGRIALAEEVIHTAQYFGDEALLAQAYTALGDELTALGRLDMARTTYEQALDILRRADIPALAIWPQGALLRAREPRADG